MVEMEGFEPSSEQLTQAHSTVSGGLRVSALLLYRRKTGISEHTLVEPVQGKKSVSITSATSR